MIDLSPQHLALVQQILRDYLSPEVEVWVYGSRVNGSAKPFSDIDLLLRAPQPTPRERLYLLENAFDDSPLPFRVDINDWHYISPEFRHVIQQRFETLSLAQCHDDA